MITMLRQGMSSGETSIYGASKAANLSRHVYHLGRKLLILVDRRVLSQAEEQTVWSTLQMLQSGRLAPAQRMSSDILKKHWLPYSSNGIHKSIVKRRKLDKLRVRFDRTIFAIREVCADKEDLEIPRQLTREECSEAAEVLSNSIASLRELLNRIKEEK